LVRVVWEDAKISKAKARAPLEPIVFDLINCLHARYDTQNSLITKEV